MEDHFQCIVADFLHSASPAQILPQKLIDWNIWYPRGNSGGDLKENSASLLWSFKWSSWLNFAGLPTDLICWWGCGGIFPAFSLACFLSPSLCLNYIVVRVVSIILVLLFKVWIIFHITRVNRNGVSTYHLLLSHTQKEPWILI